MEQQILNLDNAEYKKSNHTSSKIQPDTLFNFMGKVDWLIEIVQNKTIPPRYCVEDITYLKIDGIEKIAYPMKCFCDINLHKLHEHIGWYGACGIAFSKQWGMEQGIQPLHYINPQSKLRKDFSEAFNSSLKMNYARQSKLQKILKNYLLHELMYYKPYSGVFINRRTSEESNKCFTDECEWRFLPNVEKFDFEQIIIYDELKKGYIDNLNAALKMVQEVSLQFEYSDIKHLIVENNDDYIKLIDAIIELPIEEHEKYLLSSKIIVWDKSKGDF